VPDEPNSVFQEAVDAWSRGLGDLRNVVRQELVRRQLGEIAVPGGSTVLDVGCGQGTQALHLARAGHRVTGLDLSAELLGQFEQALSSEPAEVRDRVTLVNGPLESAGTLTPGPFGLVLCHGVLMYFDDIAPVLAALDRVAAPDGLLSLLVRNGLAPAMRDGLMGDWAAALAAFDSLDYVNRLGVPARANTPEQLDGLLEPLGWRRERWYGVRVFTDHHGDLPPPSDGRSEMLDAEEEAGRRDPYRQVAALLHLVYRRGRAPVS
jgi:S-adenosylmethionine-dependent methyltransferase